MENSQQDVLPEGEPYIAAKFPHRTIPWTFYLGNGDTYDGFLNRKLDQNVKYKIFVRAFVDTPQKVIRKFRFIVLIENISADLMLYKHFFYIKNNLLGPIVSHVCRMHHFLRKHFDNVSWVQT